MFTCQQVTAAAGRVSGFADRGYMVRVRSDYDTLEARANDTSRVRRHPVALATKCIVVHAICMSCCCRKLQGNVRALQVEAPNPHVFDTDSTGEGASRGRSAFHLDRLSQPAYLLQQQLSGNTVCSQYCICEAQNVRKVCSIPGS